MKENQNGYAIQWSCNFQQIQCPPIRIELQKSCNFQQIQCQPIRIELQKS